FPASAFPPADYIALGHIHRPQKVAKTEHIRYCGSPMALSFDELGREKEVLMVELQPGVGFVNAESLTVPVFQPLIRLSGGLSDIEAQLSDLSDQTAQLASGQTLWAEINVQTEDYLADL
ncbi:exonuclease subunit SbcD, partial [Oceanospirillum sp. HFRX-1_2]